MNITPETIAEMASMIVEMTPIQAVGYLDDVSKKYNGTRADHNVLRSAVNLLTKIVREHERMTAQIEKLGKELEEANGKIDAIEESGP